MFATTAVTAAATARYISRKTYHPQVMDVFRDTIQTKSASNYTLLNKQQDLFNIINKRGVSAVEVGSFASPKVLPVMADTKKLLNYCHAIAPQKAYYVLTPTHKQLVANLDESTYNKISGVSFITSASERFQMKNVHKTLEATYKDIVMSLDYLGEFDRATAITHRLSNKLYVSCINRCPVGGGEIMTHHAICTAIAMYIPLVKEGVIANVCLSDTCGTLNARDFKEIIELLECMGLPYKNMGLHLHVNAARLDETKKVLGVALNKQIGHFDVTTMGGGGGCAVTMSSAECHPNMSLDLLRDVWWGTRE